MGSFIFHPTPKPLSSSGVLVLEDKNVVPWMPQESFAKWSPLPISPGSRMRMGRKNHSMRRKILWWSCLKKTANLMIIEEQQLLVTWAAILDL
jgi:hypothetical protein